MKAFNYWYQSYPYPNADELVFPFLNSGDFQTGWICRARKALFLSTNHMAAKLGIDKSTYIRMEQAEKKGTIKLESVRRIAEAMDCELVYAIRPKSKKIFSRVIWDKLESEVQRHFKGHPLPKNFERRFSAVAKMRMAETKFRKKNKWTERLDSNSRGLSEWLRYRRSR